MTTCHISSAPFTIAIGMLSLELDAQFQRGSHLRQVLTLLLLHRFLKLKMGSHFPFKSRIYSENKIMISFYVALSIHKRFKISKWDNRLQHTRDIVPNDEARTCNFLLIVM